MRVCIESVITHLSETLKHPLLTDCYPSQMTASRVFAVSYQELRAFN